MHQIRESVLHKCQPVKSANYRSSCCCVGLIWRRQFFLNTVFKKTSPIRNPALPSDQHLMGDLFYNTSLTTHTRGVTHLTLKVESLLSSSRDNAESCMQLKWREFSEIVAFMLIRLYKKYVSVWCETSIYMTWKQSCIVTGLFLSVHARGIGYMQNMRAFKTVCPLRNELHLDITTAVKVTIKVITFT